MPSIKFRSNLLAPIRKSIKKATIIVDDKFNPNGILNWISTLPLYCWNQIAIKFKIIPKKEKTKAYSLEYLTLLSKKLL